MMPNIVIFRIPDDSELTLVSYPIVDGKIDQYDGGEVFTVEAGDWYGETEFNHLILATSCDGGSVDARRFLIGNSVSEREVRVCDLDPDAIDLTITYVLLEEYLNNPQPTVH